jgi:hypothetical protein
MANKREREDQPAEEPLTKKNGDDECYWEISNARRATVRKFKKTVLIDVREYYSDKTSGESKPGSKGISLTPEQWQALKAAIPLIDAELQRLKGE